MHGYEVTSDTLYMKSNS